MSMMTLQAAFVSGELAPSLSARVDLSKYSHGCRLLKNFKVQPHGGAVKRPGFLLLDELPAEAFLIGFVFNQDQAYCLAFGEHWLRVFTVDGPVLADDGRIYEIESPYSLAQAKLMSTAQSADVLFIACEGVAPHKLKRLGHNQWEFEALSFEAPIEPPDGLTAVRTGGSEDTNYAYYVTAIDSEGRESELSEGFEIMGPASNNWPSGAKISLSWDPLIEAVEYNVYKSTFGGRPGFMALVGQPENAFDENGDPTGVKLTYVDYNTTASLSEGAPAYDDPFPDGDYPRVVSFFEQRLVFASTPNRPQTIFMSKSGDYTNFATYTPQTASSPWEGTVASNVMSPFVWMAALRSLVVGGMMMELEVSASQGAFSAETAKVTPQSYIGSDRLPALIIGNRILHISRSGSQVRDLKYDFGADSYGGTDCSVMAAHLLEKERVVDWTYQQQPDSVVWMARSDGLLLGMTFQAEHEVIAWHRHETAGVFLSVCSVPDGHDDALFTVVKRRVQDSDRYFMEKMAPQYIDGDYSLHSFLDCSLIYDRPGEPVSVLNGLDHLEGREVGVLSRGAVEHNRVVENGSIKLDAESDRVIVGLPYSAEIETMPVEVVGQNGSSVGKKKQINAVSLRVHETVGADVGLKLDQSDNVSASTIKWRSTEPYGSPPRPFSGDKRMVVAGMARNVVRVFISSPEPTPMTVLAVMAEIDVK